MKRIIWLVKGALGRYEMMADSGTLYIWLKYKDQQNSYSVRCRKSSTNHFSVSTGRKCYLVTWLCSTHQVSTMCECDGGTRDW